MVNIIHEICENNVRQITLKCERNNENDKIIIDKICHLLFHEQPRCENCVNYYREGSFCGYNAVMCKLHGGLDAFDHPHHDLDGSKCEDYERKIESEAKE